MHSGGNGSNSDQDSGALRRSTARAITGVVLAGGRGARMGGLDKGLQLFHGTPLALHALNRLRPQVSGAILIANRHRADYAAFGVPVWVDARSDDNDPAHTLPDTLPDILSDTLPDYAGPLAGFLAGLTHCPTPWLLTVPCDTPHFPLDLAQRLAREVSEPGRLIAMATDGVRPQPVFCLLHRSLSASLEDFLRQGGRKIGEWAARHDAVRVPFDAVDAFVNINSLDELRALEG